MKIFTAWLWHESSSFSPLPTDLEDYKKSILYRPSTGEGAEKWALAKHVAPLAEYSEERGHDVVEGLAAMATPSGLTARAVYEALRDELLDNLRSAGAVDAVLLFLHGAQMAHGYDDCEGDLLTRIRHIVGERVFVGAVLDLHCNISNAMVSAANALIPCKEYPHTDWPQRSRDLVHIAEAAFEKRASPRTVFHPTPMLGVFHTAREPLRAFVDELTGLEGANGVLAANLAHGFPLSDQQDTGAGVLLVVDGAMERHRELARELGHRFFALREQIARKHPSLESALGEVEELLKQKQDGPIVLADTSDNPGGGAPGDSTFILRALLERKVRGSSVAAMWDPVAVSVATAAGVGSRLWLRVGGKLGPLSGDPLDLDVTVVALHPSLTQASFAAGQRSWLGASATVETEGIHIVLTSIRQQVVGPDLFSAMGVDPQQQRLLVVKSAQHFHANFAPIASHIVYAQAPGYANKDLAALPHKSLRRPIWPLDRAPFEAHGEVWS